ncbi:MAG: hypothetical protein HYY77_19455, partial [Betaproteobacteria bacterium]|nr:hypothetical protein [Betaproteobacteria bacterium]
MAAITKGITVSFANTPQARDDLLTNTGLTEDSLGGIKYLDVMANDLGGAAKWLYSLDDGISAGGSSPTDLLSQDAVGSANYSRWGAQIWITADGKVAYDANTLDSDFKASLQTLAAGAFATDSFTYAIRLANGALSWATATVQIAGTNDGPVITSGAQSGAVQEDVTLAVSGQVSATDVDNGDHLHYAVLNGAGSYGSLSVDADTGAWTYTLDNGTNGVAGAVQSLAQDETHDENFTVRVTDDQGAMADQVVTVTVTGTNDAPVITGGATTGSVTENTVSQATGQLTALDVDHGANAFWSVVGGIPSGNADYHFRMDQITITKNGSVIFQDGFADGNPPPSPAPGYSTTYGRSGGFGEANGKLLLDSNNAVSFSGAGTTDPYIGNEALVRTNINPNITSGLQSNSNFTVEGIFDLILPDSPREEYGIRLSDRQVGGLGTPPDQLGDDIIELGVRENRNGSLIVALREIDIVADQVTTIQSIALSPPPDADQIRLRLEHSTSNVGALVPSFDYLADGVVVGTHPIFTQVGRIFGTETPGYAGDDENWTRAVIHAAAPAVNDSLLGGTYGTLNVDQAGNWVYNLDNGRTATQNLAEGQTATDPFTVKVADQFGAFDTRE